MVYSDARQYSQAGEYALTLSGGRAWHLEL